MVSHVPLTQKQRARLLGRVHNTRRYTLMYSIMYSIQGHKVKIIKSGTQDMEHQHIQRDAKIEIDGKSLVGDVVVTDTIKDYYYQRFHLDILLNQCVLHVAKRDVFTNLRIRKQNGKTIPTVILHWV